MKISELLKEIKNRNPLLYYFGWANLLLLAASFVLYLLDDTRITGINAWIKPMKFAISVAIYSWTFAWVLHYLKNKRNRNFISWVVFICMFVENFIITLQAARGEISHYNITPPLNAMLFGIMGTFIVINTLINLYALILFCIKSQVTLTSTMLVAWRAGLLLFFLGSISGGLMISHMGHTVGAVDGGIGLPFTNWSTQAGDIRVAHFFTLHGLQIIPLFAWFIAERKKHSTLYNSFFLYLFNHLFGYAFARLVWKTPYPDLNFTKEILISANPYLSSYQQMKNTQNITLHHHRHVNHADCGYAMF